MCKNIQTTVDKYKKHLSISYRINNAAFVHVNLAYSAELRQRRFH